MGNSSALRPETFTSLETLSSLLLRDSGSAIPSGKARPAKGFPSALSGSMARSHSMEIAAISETSLEGSLTAHTAQVPIPAGRLVFLVTHGPPFLLHHPVFSKPNISARAEDGSLLPDAPGAIMTTLLTMTALQLLLCPHQHRSTLRHDLHPHAALS